jgi:hypothetical protein
MRPRWIGYRATAAGVAVVVALVGCQASAPTSAPTQAAIGSSAAPAASSESTVFPTISPVASLSGPDDAAAPPASAVPIGGWTTLQLYILAGVDDAIRPSCAPATGFGNGALAGVECHPEGYRSMGFYAFPTRKAMFDLYFKRLSQYGVAKDGGHGCEDGKPGEAEDSPGDYANPRIGCFVDADGHANARMALPNQDEFDGVSIYIGVVGVDASIDHLFATMFPDHQPGAVGALWGIYQWSEPQYVTR